MNTAAWRPPERAAPISTPTAVCPSDRPRRRAGFARAADRITSTSGGRSARASVRPRMAAVATVFASVRGLVISIVTARHRTFAAAARAAIGDSECVSTSVTIPHPRPWLHAGLAQRLGGKPFGSSLSYGDRACIRWRTAAELFTLGRALGSFSHKAYRVVTL